MVFKGRSCIRFAIAALWFAAIAVAGWAQTLRYLPLQQPGQASVAIDLKRHAAYIFDLGKPGDGDTVTISTANGEAGLFDYLDLQGVRSLTVVCSHPHADHMGGITAAFQKQATFVRADGTARFDTVNIVDDGMGLVGRLDAILKTTLKSAPQVAVKHISARENNALVGISKPSDDVYVQTVPYPADPAAGPHGRSVVSRITLGGKNTVIDFDDADNAVITKAVTYLKTNGVHEIESFVVPHHGSALHDIEPILSLKPKRAIIAVNPANKYGHPAAPILRTLMDKLGPENVIFTGSEGHVEFDPEGLKYARYTAADPESYALFVDPSRRRAERLGKTAEVDDYEAIRATMMKGDDLPPGQAAKAAGPNPPAGSPSGAAANSAEPTSADAFRPRPASVARHDAYVLRIQNNETALSEEFDLGSIKSGGIQPAVLRRGKLFRHNGNAKRASSTVWISRDEEYDVLPKKNASLSPTELSVIRDHFQLAGSDADADAPITVISSTDSGVSNAMEPQQHLANRIMKASPEAATAGAGHVPKGGMVYLTGGKLFATANASELLGGTLDLCGNDPCVTFPGAGNQPFHLPFAFNQLFAEVWSRVHDRSVDAFYLSINPTKSWLRNVSMQVPTERLEFGRSPNPSAANEVVTAGDIQGTEIGRILWESDVAFKSAGVGFDVLKGRNGQQVRAVASLSDEDDSTDADMDVNQGDRWCRLYWESGSLRMSADPGTRKVTFIGDAVTARAQAMVLKSGQLQDYEKGGWCGGAKHIARELQGVANTTSGPVPVLNQLRQLATIQTFARWARDNGLPQTDQFKSAMTSHQPPSPTFVIPTWTSGIQSSFPVLVQKQTNRLTNTYLLHISVDSYETVKRCVVPFWDAQDKELPALGLKDKNGGWVGPDIFTVIDGWMNGFANRVSQCSGGVVLAPVSEGGLDFLTDLSREGSMRYLTHLQPVNIHGGVLLGHNTESLENFWKSGDELRSPLGRLLFRRNGNNLQFWSSESASAGGAEARNYVFVRGGSVFKAHLHDGHLRFIVQTLPGAVVRQEMRILASGEEPRGLEWIEARNGQDGSLISHAAIRRCREPSAADPECIIVESASERALGPIAHEAGYDLAPPIGVKQVQEGVWLIDLDLSSVYDQIDQLAGTAQDNAARISKLVQYRRWGCEGDRLKSAEQVIPDVEQDTQDTLLTRQDNKETLDFLVAERIKRQQDRIKEGIEASDTLTRASVNSMLSELKQLDGLIGNLSPESSGPRYEIQIEILDAATQITVPPTAKNDSSKDLSNLRAQYVEWITLDKALAEGYENLWAEHPSAN